LKQFQTSGEKRDPIIMSFDLVIDVLAGRDLPKMDNVGQIDPYVVLTIVSQKKKTKTPYNTIRYIAFINTRTK
jgi:hypothetical protein